MPKIGLITYHFVLNYGAFMQAWALQNHLIKKGFSVEIIDYKPAHLEKGGGLFFPRNKKDIIIIIYKVALNFKYLLGFFSSFRACLATTFRKAQKDEFCLSKKSYFSSKDLKDISKNYDIIICGSDQIWNASKQNGIDEAYFLNFVNSECRTISYAASFGRPFIEKEYRQSIERLINKIDYISVREKSGVNLVNNLGSKKAIQAVDPTLLLEYDYSNAIKPSLDVDTYAFSYTLRSQEFAKKVNTFIESTESIKIYTMQKLKKSKITPSPFEWIGYFKYAKYITTNSYHGTIFSIIFNKPFIFVSLEGQKAAFNDRTNSLLEVLGMKDRILSGYNEAAISQLISKEINWEEINLKLKGLRKKSELFLDQAINA